MVSTESPDGAALGKQSIDPIPERTDCSDDPAGRALVEPEVSSWVDAGSNFGGVTPFLILENLRVERGKAEDAFVLEIEELRIPAGSFTAILGGSGIGKTTLLTVLGLLRGPHEEPDLRLTCGHFALCGGSGAEKVVVFDGLTADGARVQLSARERERLRREWIGFCLQGGELVPSLTLEDNCAVPAELCALSDTQARAHDYLRLLGMVDSELGDQTRKLPGELSGGQRQRGVVARALAHGPRMVLLDEPTAALDRGTAQEAIGLLRDLARRNGQTVIMVTHDRALAEGYADFIVHIDLHQKKHSRIGRCQARSVRVEADAVKTTPAMELTGRGLPRWRYHVKLGLMDALGPMFHSLASLRRRSASGRPPIGRSGTRFLLQLVQNSAVVIAIAMLVLFLRGMRSGMIDDFRQALEASPTARKITVFGVFEPDDLDRIKGLSPSIEQVLPVATPRVALGPAGEMEFPRDDSPLSRVTLNGVVERDPTLRLLGASKQVDQVRQDQIVLTKKAADLLSVRVGGSVRVWVERQLDAEGRESGRDSALLQVYDILPGVDHPIGIAWVHFDFTRDISRFLAGLRVETDAYTWSGVKKRLVPEFECFLLFVRAADNQEEALPEADKRLLHERSFRVEAIQGEERQALLGSLLKDERELARLNDELRASGHQPYAPLAVYRCVSQRGVPLLLSQMNVEESLVCGGVLVPWNKPLGAQSADGRTLRLSGLSFSRLPPQHIRAQLRDMPHVFTVRDSSWKLVASNSAGVAGPRSLRLGPEESSVEIILDGLVSPATGGSSASGVVSSQLLARMHALVRGEARLDQERRVIHRISGQEEFRRLHVFPRSVFDVPDIMADITSRGYQAVASTDQLREIQGYTSVLGYIVRVTSVLAGVIALFTIMIVFHDIGRSKKRTLATLRIMGLTRGGAFTLLMVRGVLLAFIAGLLLIVAGTVGSSLLNLAAGRRVCLLGAGDYLFVLGGILFVCIAGTYFPARAVSRTEPVVALQEAEQLG